MHAIKRSALLYLFGSLAFLSCNKDPVGHGAKTGTVQLYLTDAPVDHPEVRGVYLTIRAICCHTERAIPYTCQVPTFLQVATISSPSLLMCNKMPMGRVLAATS